MEQERAEGVTYRQVENILFVQYSDLLGDFEGKIRRVARFLEIDAPEGGGRYRAQTVLSRG
jgi:hypothetical protein